MEEYLTDSDVELKRAEHLLYVSLKYTRTVDVIKSIILRLISAFNFLIDGLLENAMELRQIDQIPTSPKIKCDALREIYSDDENMLNFLDFYILLRKLNLSKFKRAREFRRHVTMTATVDDKDVEVDIDIISDYFKKSKDFFEYTKNLGQEMEA